MEAIAIQGYTVTQTPDGGSWIPGIPTFVEIPSTKIFINGKYLVLDKLQWTVAGCTLAGHVYNNDGHDTTPIQATNLKVLAETKKCLRVGDTGVCEGSFTPSGGGSPIPCKCNFEITNAGQTKVICG